MSPISDACGSRGHVILNAFTLLLISPELGSKLLHRPMWVMWEAAQSLRIDRINAGGAVAPWLIAALRDRQVDSVAKRGQLWLRIHDASFR